MSELAKIYQRSANTMADKYAELGTKLEQANARIAELEQALSALADRAEGIDNLLLAATKSAKECELGEVARARALLPK